MAEKILLVDDEMDTLQLVGLLLEQQGYEIVAALDGEEGLEKAHSESPDLVLLDIIMPGTDGLEVCRQLRAEAQTATLPIILFTSKGREDPAARIEGLQAGADDFISKPVHPEELVMRVRAVLMRSARQPTKDGKALAFLGAKGGVGTTTLAVNVAVSLAHSADDRRVVLADLRGGGGTLGAGLGLQPRSGISSLLTCPADEITSRMVEQQLQNHSSGLQVLAGQSAPRGEAVLPKEHASKIVDLLTQLADFVVVDLGDGLAEGTRGAIDKAHQVLVVVEPQHTTVAVAEELLEVMKTSLGLPDHRISLVMINKGAAAPGLGKDTIERELGHTLIGIVTPAADLVVQSSTNRDALVTMHPESAVATQFRSIAEYLVRL